MAEQLQPKPNQAPTHDAQLTAENMIEGTEKAPQIDVNADYEASKAFSVSEIDRTTEGAAAAAAATAPQLEVPQAKETTYKAEPTGNPSDYVDMARDINPVAEGATNITDDLVAKALEKGQPAK